MNQHATNPRSSWALEARQRGAARIDAALIADGAGTHVPFGTLVLERVGLHSGRPVPQVPLSGRWKVAAVLSTEEPAVVTRFSGIPTLDLRRHAIIPGLVNAHTHLDLTHVGPREYDPAGGFAGWIDVVRRERASTVDQIEASVSAGVAASLAGGTVAVGDISGAIFGKASTIAAQALTRSPLSGVSFVEFFAIGRGESLGIAAMQAALAGVPCCGGSMRIGLQPHAPNTASLRAYSAAADEAERCGIPLATHLAETGEEREFIARGTGPQRTLLERLGLWDAERIEAGGIGKGLSPTQHLAPVLQRARFVLAHANVVDDSDIHLLEQTRQTVAYCPRAHDYFRHQHTIGQHRYRDLLGAGVNVALGTDSVINLPVDVASSMSILDEMRLLYLRDGTEPRTLLAMGTTNGAAALGIDPATFLLTENHEVAGLNAVLMRPGVANPSLGDVVTGQTPPELLLIRN